MARSFRGYGKLTPAVEKTKLPRKSVLVLGALILAGCTNTYVDVPKISLASKSGIFPETTKFVNQFEDLRINSVQDPRNRVARTRQVLGLSTFGAGLGAAIAALYDAHRDITLGFGVAGATSLAVNNLYLSPEKTKLLNSANKALGCVTEIGNTFVSTGITVSNNIAIDDRVEKDLKSKVTDAKDYLDTTKFSWAARQAALKTELEGALKTAEGALAKYKLEKNNFNKFKNLDATASGQLAKAARALINSLNTQLELLEPSPEAIARTAQSLPKLGISFANQAISSAGGAAGGAAAAPPPAAPKVAPGKAAVPDADVRKLITEMTAQAADLDQSAGAIKTSIQGPVNQLDQIGETCAFTPVAIGDLMASQTSPTITTNSTVVVTLTGGKLPITTMWVGTPPKSGEVDVNVVAGRNLVITGKASVTAGTHELLVQDSLAVPKSLELTITLQ